VQELAVIPSKYNIEFIMVENGSTDSSRKEFAKIKNARIHKTFVEKNRGYGYGIKAGVKVARGDYIGWMHADLQYAPKDLTQFFDFLLDHNSDKYFLKARREGRTGMDRFFSFNMGIVDSLLFHKKMQEVMSGITIAPREIFVRLDKFPDDFSIDIYTYALAQKNGYKVAHLPVSLRTRKGGKSSWNTGLKAKIKMSKTLLTESIKVKQELGQK
jgi:glycosyltransferase involved in cell wall biosynthesis